MIRKKYCHIIFFMHTSLIETLLNIMLYVVLLLKRCLLLDINQAISLNFGGGISSSMSDEMSSLLGVTLLI